MRIKQSTLFIITTVLMAVIFSMRFSSHWRYITGIEDYGVVVDREVPVEKREAQLEGFDVDEIDADPEHPGHVLVQNEHDTFVTNNHGKTWQAVSRRNFRSTGDTELGDSETSSEFLWVNKKLVAPLSTRPLLVFSDNLGHAWSVLENQAIDSFGHLDSYFNMRRDARGRPWITLHHRNQFIDYTIGTEADRLKLQRSDRAEFRDGWYLSANIVSPGGGHLYVHHAVKAADGLWAATERGPFFRASGSQSWVEKTGNIKAGRLSTIATSPENAGELLTWASGRLWFSRDMGKNWQSIKTSGHVAHAGFLSDGSIIAGYANHAVALIRDHVETVIAGKNVLPDTMQRHLETKTAPKRNPYGLNDSNVDKKRFRIHAMGGTAETIWVVAGDSIFYLRQAAVRKGTYHNIVRNINDYHGDQSPRLRLFVYSADQSWRIYPLEQLKQYEPPPNTPCHLNLKDNTLYINDHAIPDDLLYGIVNRAGWLKHGSMYFAMSDWRAQVGAVKNCRPKGLSHAWNFDGLAAYPDTEIVETPDGFQALTPAGSAVSYFQIQYRFPPLWRWLLYHVSFGPGLFIVWGMLLLWGWRIYRRP